MCGTASKLIAILGSMVLTRHAVCAQNFGTHGQLNKMFDELTRLLLHGSH